MHRTDLEQKKVNKHRLFIMFTLHLRERNVGWEFLKVFFLFFSCVKLDSNSIYNRLSGTLLTLVCMVRVSVCIICITSRTYYSCNLMWFSRLYMRTFGAIIYIIYHHQSEMCFWIRKTKNRRTKPSPPLFWAVQRKLKWNFSIRSRFIGSPSDENVFEIFYWWHGHAEAL